MQHDPYFSLAHPVTPLRDCPPHIQRMFGYTPKRASVTKDGRLTCSCGNATGCTCRPTRDAALAPAKPSKPRISQAAAIGAVLALKHLDARLQVLEQRVASGGSGGSSDLDQRLAEAEQKRVAMAKEVRINKIEKLVEQHEHDKEPSDNLEPAKAEDQPGAKDDRAKYGAGRFDPSCGNQSQKTPKHPVGDSTLTKAAYEQLAAWHEAKKFFDRELAAKRAWIAEIEESNRQRWN